MQHDEQKIRDEQDEARDIDARDLNDADLEMRAGVESQSATERRRRRNTIVAVVAALVVLSLIAGWYVLRAKPAADAATDETQIVVSVRTAKVERQQIAAEVSSIGTIFPREQATVSANTGAQIRTMGLLKNKLVRQGEVIAQLDVRDLQAQRAEAVAALADARLQARGVTAGAIPQANAQAEKDLSDARATVENARTLYERRRELYRQEGIALKDVEAAQLALTNAENNLRLTQRNASLRATAIAPNESALATSRITQAQERVRTIDAQLSYANVRAPLTGIVTEQFQYKGEYATAGGRLATIADISEVIVKAQFADTVVANLQTGDAATILPTDAPGERMGGKISLISRSSDALNRTVEVWVALANGAGRLRAGGAAEVRVATKNAGDALVIPASAVTLDATNADEGTVMVVDGASVAHETKVVVGIRTPETIQITSGLNAGDTVVIEGNYALPDKTKVEINDEPGGEGGDSSGEGGDAGGDKASVKGGAGGDKSNDASDKKGGVGGGGDNKAGDEK